MAISLREDVATFAGVGPIEVVVTYVPNGSPAIGFNIGAWGKSFIETDVQKIAEALLAAIERGHVLSRTLDRVLDRRG